MVVDADPVVPVVVDWFQLLVPTGVALLDDIGGVMVEVGAIIGGPAKEGTNPGGPESLGRLASFWAISSSALRIAAVVASSTTGTAAATGVVVAVDGVDDNDDGSGAWGGTWDGGIGMLVGVDATVFSRGLLILI